MGGISLPMSSHFGGDLSGLKVENAKRHIANHFGASVQNATRKLSQVANVVAPIVEVALTAGLANSMITLAKSNDMPTVDATSTNQQKRTSKQSAPSMNMGMPGPKGPGDMG